MNSVKNISLFIIASILLNWNAITHASDDELIAFGETLVDIHARQAKDEYLKLIHPDCPAPIPEALDSTFSNKWLTDQPYQIRIKSVEDTFDLNILAFQVKPEFSLEIQVWFKEVGKVKAELSTVFPIAKFNDQLKIVDYPCFDVK